MIEFSKITGKIKGDSYQVRRRTGEHIFAPIAITGIDVPAPSSAWIDKHKDNFLALLTREGTSDNFFIIGFYPVKGASSEEYGVVERLLKANLDLLDVLLNAKTNTALGPMPFMPTSIKKLVEVNSELKEIAKLIKPIKNA